MVTKAKENEEKKPSKKLTVKEIEELIVQLAEKDTPPAKIGLILKKEHGVSKAKYEVGKVRKILVKHQKATFPAELTDLIKKATKLRAHRTKNHKDQTAKRGLQITEARIRKLATYFKKKGMLDKKWIYTTK
ncbi:30S ribosomal protein S15 [Nanoarchaeota archaeon]